MNNKELRSIVEKVVMKHLENELYISVGVSNRHVHLSNKDLKLLFGDNYVLTKLRDLKQPGQYAANEVVTIIGPKGEIKRVRILGPVRKQTQVELSISDGYKLGVNLQVKESGNLSGTPGVKICGPNGTIEIKEGAIAAFRHIHVPLTIAEKYNLQDGQFVSAISSGVRSTTFHNILIRVSEKYALEMHLDVEEANSSGIKKNDLFRIVP